MGPSHARVAPHGGALARPLPVAARKGMAKASRSHIGSHPIRPAEWLLREKALVFSSPCYRACSSGTLRPPARIAS